MGQFWQTLTAAPIPEATGRRFETDCGHPARSRSCASGRAKPRTDWDEEDVEEGAQTRSGSPRRRARALSPERAHQHSFSSGEARQRSRREVIQHSQFAYNPSGRWHRLRIVAMIRDSQFRREIATQVTNCDLLAPNKPLETCWRMLAYLQVPELNTTKGGKLFFPLIK